MGKDPGAGAPTALMIESFDDVATALMAIHGKIDTRFGDVDDGLKKVSKRFDDQDARWVRAEKFFSETDNRLGRVEKSLGEMGRIEKLVAECTSQVKALGDRGEATKGRLDRFDEKLDAMVERLDRPVTAVFKPGPEFYNTMGTRMGEELRASLRAELGTIAQQMSTGIDTALKANAPKPAWGASVTPIAALIAAAAGVTKLVWDYQAAKSYVPADVKVHVNGTHVPHQVQQSPSLAHPMNGTRFARAS